MSKKVLILSGSPRKGGNSDILCDEFARGAQETGNEVEKIRVASKKIHPCSACYYCRDHGGACVHKDDMAESKYNLEYCNKITNAAGRRVWGFFGIEAIARPNINGFSDVSEHTYVQEDWR